MFRKPVHAWALVLLFSLVAGYFWVGHYFYRVGIGLDASGFFAGEAIQSLATRVSPELSNTAAGGVLLVLTLLAVGVAAFFFMRSAVRARRVVDEGRRSLLAGAGAGAGAAVVAVLTSGAAAASRALFGVGTGTDGWLPTLSHIQDREVTYTHPAPKPEWRGSRVSAYRRFGRTDFQVSDIVLGTGRIRGRDGERIAREALDRGVNYFDTSPDYAGAGSEQAMGRAIKGVRDRLFIATKFCTPIGHLPAGTPVTAYMEAIEGSLRRLGTDYVDLIHIHACDELDRLNDPNVHEAFDRLREQGKARFLGFSTHTPNLVQVANGAIDSGRFDVMMLAYHHGIWPQLSEIIERARTAQDMGVVAMKTLKGAKHRGLLDFEPYADSYSQAALRWVLANPDISCAVISFYEMQHVDEFLYASGKPLTEADLAVLGEYDRRTAGSYCPPHCGECLEACPAGLPIADLHRYRMYAEDYGWQREGVRLYAKLERNASACLGCSAPCTGTCPEGIPIRERLLGAHELLA